MRLDATLELIKGEVLTGHHYILELRPRNSMHLASCSLHRVWGDWLYNCRIDGPINLACHEQVAHRLFRDDLERVRWIWMIKGMRGWCWKEFLDVIPSEHVEWAKDVLGRYQAVEAHFREEGR